MKIFNTTNKLCAAVAMTVAISMGTSAHADVVYSGEMHTSSLENGYFDDIFNDETSVLVDHNYGEGLAVLSGDQDGFNLHAANYDDWDIVEFDLNLAIAFDTATEITISSSVWEGGFIFDWTGPEDGTFTVDAGDTFHYDLHWFSQTSTYTVDVNVTFTEIPAPSALALLGLAGISTRRRRR